MSGIDSIYYGDKFLEEKSQEKLERQKKRNILVAKKDKYDTISPSLNKVIQEVLGIEDVEAKIYEQYELENGLTDAQWLQASRTILGDSPLDDIYDCEKHGYDHVIAQRHSYLRITTVDGQYNAREDAVKQCFMQFTGFDTDIPLRCSRIIAFDRELTDEELKRIESHLVNPLEEKTLDIADNNLQKNTITPDDVQHVQGFITDHGGNKIAYFEDTIKLHKLSMSVEDMDCIYEYFKEDGRNPTIAEFKIIDTYRSDHCRHTTFNTEIQNINFEKEGGIFDHIKKSQESYMAAKEELGRSQKPITLMELAQMSMKYQKAYPELYPNIVNLEVSEENNAYTFKTMVEREDGSSEEWLISFKNETHNHPTEIAPFGGAATCLGGCIRDPLSARSWVFQAMRVTGSADPTQPVSEKMANKLAQRVISQLAALGFASYGNQIGLAAGQVQEYFHPGFAAKRFEVGYVIAGAPAQNIVKREPEAGDKIILIGGKTGRDGIGGATGSSKVHDATSVTALGAEVQRGNPVEERKLTKLFLDPRFARHVKKCNDGGAGGISVMIGELARGLDIDLDKVPLKYAGLDGSEIALSESQERMAIVIAPEDYDAVIELIRLYNLEGTLLGEVNNEELLPQADFLTMNRRGKPIVNISRDFLDQAGAKRTMEHVHITGKEKVHFFETIPHEVQQEKDPIKKFLANLKRKEVASQKGLQAGFDSSVGASNVLAPYGGQYQNTPQVGMISKVPVFDNGADAVTTTISTHGYNPDLAEESPYLQAIYAVILSLSKQVALGGNYKTARNSLQEYFGKLGKDPAKRGDTYSALLGAWEICKRFAPSIGGKDSMSGTYVADGNRIDVPPTVVSFAANTGHIDNVISGEFKEAHTCAVCFEVPKDEYGMPDLDAYQIQLDKIQELIASGEVKAAHVVEEGGIAATITKMCAGNKMGFSFEHDVTAGDYIYKPLLGSIVVEMSSEPGRIPNTRIIGEVLEPNDDIYIDNRSVSLNTVIETRQDPLNEVFPFLKGGRDMECLDVPQKAQVRHGLPGNTMMHVRNFVADKLSISILKTAPTLLIPVFPGTNSEIDTARAAVKKGFNVQQFIFRNQTQQELMDSVKTFANLVKKAHMIVFPGGFSAGDEPDGSAKFIASVCRMAFLRDVLNNHFINNSTLTAGICNGFQALIKLGVFDDGVIKDYLGEKDLTLTHNTNHRHITDHVGLQITSVISPMLNFADIGEIFVVPVSHGEGRIVGAEETIRKMIKDGQVFAQYLDPDGTPTNEYNGSMLGVGGMTNRTGTILGMMPHPERTNNTLFQNIPGNKNFDIFGSAAKAFGVGSYKNIMNKNIQYIEMVQGSGLGPIIGK